MDPSEQGLPSTGPVPTSARAAPARRVAVGSRLGPYEITGRLGAGSMGEVFRAKDPRLGRDVAVKVLPAHAAADPEALRRFATEARAAGALNHPNIVTIHDVGTDEGMPYVVCELVDGERLAGKLAPAEALQLVRQICAGLGVAHEKGIVHRDLKPGNLLVTRDGVVKILDFGLAKLLATPASEGQTESGAVMGTPGYMSPEQVRGQSVDHRSDLFSLGVVLYELLSGARPFAGASSVERMSATLDREPPPLAGVPPWLGQVVARCLDKEPARRFQSARELALALQAPASAEPPAARRRRRWPLAVAIGGLVLAASSFFLLRRAAVPPPPPIRSLAVLPFTPLVPGQADEALELGIADTLIARLGSVRELRVRPLSAVRAYVAGEPDAVAAGRAQRVDAVLEGHIQIAGDTLRVTVRLLRVADETLLWSDRFDARRTSLFAVEDSIAERVAAALDAHLSGDERARLARRDTTDPEAHRLYQLGRYHLNRRTDEGFRKGLEHFQQAIVRDPSYALAYVGVADANTHLAEMDAVAPREAFPRASQAAEEALRLDERLAEAHAARATVQFLYDWSWADAEREYRRALELGPSSADTHQNYGSFLSARGRFDEAIAEMERAVELDPLSPAKICAVAEVQIVARRFAAAEAQLRAAVEMDPNFGFAHWALGRALVGQGRYDEAFAAFRRAIPLSGDSPDEPAELARAFALAGKRREAQEILDELLGRAKQQYIAPAVVAAVYGALGDADQAFTWLARAYEARDFLLALLEVEPMFDPLRTDPRFAELVRRVNRSR